MRKNNVLKIFVIILCLFFSGCSASETRGKMEEGKINIKLITYTDEKMMERNPGYESFDRVKDEWIQQNPDVNVIETIEKMDFYNSEIAMKATQDKLPDLYFFPCSYFLEWRMMNLMMDVSEYIDADSYDKDVLNSASFDGQILGFPLFLVNGTIVLYRKDQYPDGFPKDMSELENIVELQIAYAGNRNIPSVLSSYVDRKWFEHFRLRDKQTMFTDQEFRNSVQKAKRLLTSPAVYRKKYSKKFEKDIIEFEKGNYSAIICSFDEAYRIITDLEGNDLLNQISFATLPGADHITYGNYYFLAVHPSVEEDPVKLKKCMEFCNYVTGRRYADELMRNTGMHSAVKSDFAYNNSKLKEMWEFIDSVPHNPVISNELSYGVWADFFADFDSLIASDDEFQEYETLSLLQDAYEKYYYTKRLQ